LKGLGCTLSNLVEYNTYENGTLTPFSLWDSYNI
jgi:hypothetical protein